MIAAAHPSASSAAPSSPSQPRLLDQVRAAARSHRLAPRTEQSHVDWITRFILFHHKRHPRELGLRHIRAFVYHVRSAHSRDNSAYDATTAVRFLYREVLKCEPSEAPPGRSGRRPATPPTVFLAPATMPTGPPTPPPTSPRPETPQAAPAPTPRPATPAVVPLPARTATPRAQPKLLDQLREAARNARLDRRVEDAYVEWVKRFILFHKLRHPSEMGQPEIAAFLKHLAVSERASRSVQEEVQAAIRFLYREVLGHAPCANTVRRLTSAQRFPAAKQPARPTSRRRQPTGSRSTQAAAAHDRLSQFAATGSVPVPAAMTTEPNSTPPSATPPKLLDRVSSALRVRHYSRRTEQAYVYWIKQFIFFHKVRHPAEMGQAEVGQFLSHLATTKHVSASTQNQALNALVFLYKHVLEKEIGLIEGVVRAKSPQRMPVVLTRDEVRQVFAHLSAVPRLVCLLLFGTGMRVLECLQLRVKDIDFQRNEIIVRRGKGGKDRVTMLPGTCKQALAEHLKTVQLQHQIDLRRGLGRAPLPNALARKYPNADREWGWQYVFPASRHYVDRRTGFQHRHHIHETVIQQAVRSAARKSGLTKHVTPHVLRHSFATDLVAANYDIRTIQDLLGHKDVSTTMIYTHVLNRGGRGVQSPADAL